MGFSLDEYYLKCFEHAISGYRFAIPLGEEDPLDKSNRRFRRRMKYAINQVDFLTFARLSYGKKFLPAKSIHMREFLNRLGLVRRREKKPKLEYVWRVDYGEKKGRPHYHILMNSTIDFKLLERCWGKGFVWIEYIRSKKEAMEYVYKYMSKSDNINQPVKRRYGCSRKDKFGKGGIPASPPSEYLVPVLIPKIDYHEFVVLHNERLKESENISTPRNGCKISSG